MAGFLVFAFIPNLLIFNITRFITGIGVGITYTIAFGYIIEITQKEVRGTIAFIASIFLSFGFLFPVIIMPLVNFKLANMLFFIAPAIQFVLCLLALESPYLYIRRGDQDKAKNVLTRLRKGDVEKEFLEISEYVKTLEKDKVGLTIFVTNPVYRNAILLTTLAIFVQQASGLGAVMAYASYIAEPGKDIIDTNVAVIIYSSVGTVMCLSAGFFVDRYGRRILYITSASICMFSHMVIATYYYLEENSWEHIHGFRLAPTLALISMNFGKGMGISPLAYIYMNEVMPNSVRPIGGCYMTIVGGILSFFAADTYVAMQENFGMASPFISYSGALFVCIAFIILFMPETKGLSFLEIQQILAGGKVKSTKNVPV